MFKTTKDKNKQKINSIYAFMNSYQNIFVVTMNIYISTPRTIINQV